MTGQGVALARTAVAANAGPGSCPERVHRCPASKWRKAVVRFYALMCVLGTVLPYSALAAWGVDHGGLDVPAMIAEIAGSRMSLFAWADVLVSAVVLIAFIRREGRRASVAGLWLPIAGTCAVGVSLGLPLFLLMRERELSRNRN